MAGLAMRNRRALHFFKAVGVICYSSQAVSAELSLDTVPDKIVLSPKGVLPGGPNVIEGRMMESAYSCWRYGEYFDHDICCCGDDGWRCWMKTAAGNFNPYTCCVWQFGPSQRCLHQNETTLHIQFDRIGEVEIHQKMTNDNMCYIYEDWMARVLTESELVQSVRSLAGRQPRVLDMGAGIGLDSVVMSRLMFCCFAQVQVSLLTVG